jgi:hypothetical protein
VVRAEPTGSAGETGITLFFTGRPWCSPALWRRWWTGSVEAMSIISDVASGVTVALIRCSTPVGLAFWQ